MDKKNGFTLIELSIVLVIIGIIVGGVLVGQDLIKAAKMRQAVGKIESYNVAVMTFKLKYNGLPGDIGNMTQFFSECSDAPSYCMGNGDRRIERSQVGGTWANEEVLFWHNLKWAGLVEHENISGTWGQASNPQPLYHVPKFLGEEDSGVEVFSPGLAVNDSNLWWQLFPTKGHSFVAGGGEGYLRYGVIPVADAKSIDDKFDDGLARSGWIHGDHSRTGDAAQRNCRVSNFSNDYNLSYTDRIHSCRLRFIAQF